MPGTQTSAKKELATDAACSFEIGPRMLRTGEDWDSQQHDNARSVTEINILQDL